MSDAPPDIDALVQRYHQLREEEDAVRTTILEARSAAALYKKNDIVEVHIATTWSEKYSWRKARIEHLSPGIANMSYSVRVWTSANKWSYRTHRIPENDVRQPEEKA